MKKGFFLSIVLCTLVYLTGCAKPKQWTTPFAYMYYECYPETHVKHFQSKTYNAKWELIQTKGYDFDINGNLIREYSINETDTTDVTTYKYKNNRLVEIINSDGAKGKTKFDNEGFLTNIRFYNDLQGKKSLCATLEMTYNSEGLLSRYIIKRENFGDLLGSNAENSGSCSEYHIEYNEGVRSSFMLIDSNYSNNQHLKYDYEYNQFGFAKNVIVFDNTSGEALHTWQYAYTYDEHNNWTGRIQKEKGRLQQTEKRVLEYYSAEEIEEAAIKITAQSNFYEGENTIFAIFGGYLENLNDRIELQLEEYDGGTILLAIVILLTVVGMILTLIRMMKRPFFKRHVLSNGMKRMWMYDSSRYLNILSYFGIALGCFIGAILVIALIGGVAWLIAWIIKIFFIIIIWIGLILTIIGALGALAKSKFAAALIPGIIILCFEKTLDRWGKEIVDWSFDFLQQVNIVDWGYHFIVNLWDGILLVFLTPVILFLAVALIIIIFTSILNGIEWIVTRIYSIRRPCPSCGSAKTPDYIISGTIHPVKLHPGTFGVFTHISPVNGKRIPTMLLNGKGQLDRKCPDCGTIIHADAKRTYGTDIHIGFVGHRSSGKSYLLYSGLSALVKSYPEKIQQIDSDQDTSIEGKKQRIDARQGIQTNVANRYRAVQLMVSSKLRPVPYHMFFYDVAGEKFNASSSSYKTAMDFYKNVQSIVFVIDPSMIDYTGIPASACIKNWSHKPSINMGETYRIDNSFSVLKDILESVGRKSKKIDFSFVCTKADMGYFEAENLTRKGITEQQIENFIRNSLGLGNLVNSAKASFNSVHFFEVSVTDVDNSNLIQLFEFLLKQKGVSIG